MSLHYLKPLFDPRSVAVFAASERRGALGTQVFRNLLNAGFEGKLYPVNPKHRKVRGRTCYQSLEQTPGPVDLAVIATPATAVAEVIRQCGEQGVKAALVLSAGFGQQSQDCTAYQRELERTAAENDLRLLGPSCLGLIRPPSGLNASLLRTPLRAGNLALVSQSDALCSAILDWAEPHRMGFSAVVSLGHALDLDVGDLLDYLALDPHTQAILLYVQDIGQARHFMSGLRSASRMKPVVVLKAASRQAETEQVFRAALNRAGVVRVQSVGQLFGAAELLAGGARVDANRLGILSNGVGPGALAAAHARDLGLEIAALSADTLDQIDALLPARCPPGGPVNILGDAPPERYGAATALCLRDPATSAVLVLFTPQCSADALASAQQLIAAAEAHPNKPVLACWMGETSVQKARELFVLHRVPCFQTPERAVEAFGYLARYRRNQQLLLQTPGPLSDARKPDVEGARLIIEGVLSSGRSLLSDVESKALLTAFHIPTVTTIEVHSPTQALVAAQSLGFPVALKANCPELGHRSDIGGVLLGIRSAQELHAGYQTLLERVQTRRPEIRLSAFTVEKMAGSPASRELLVGISRDPAFGPVIRFGSGGTWIEPLGDHAVALPPLNRVLARRLIHRTRAAALLEPFRQISGVDRAAVEDVLLRVSEMACELPHIRELQISPLLADAREVVAVDCRILVEHPEPAAVPYAHMAIHPYPAQLEIHTHLPDGTELEIRPMRPEDAEIEQAFVRSLSPESRYFRFMQSISELTPEMLVRFTQPDYDRELALIALARKDGTRLQIGVARYAINPDRESCEFALVVSDQWHHQGIGSRLMKQLFEAARYRGLKRIEGEVLAGNRQMLALTRELGFSQRPSPEDASVRIVERRL